MHRRGRYEAKRGGTRAGPRWIVTRSGWTTGRYLYAAPKTSDRLIHRSIDHSFIHSRPCGSRGTPTRVEPPPVLSPGATTPSATPSGPVLPHRCRRNRTHHHPIPYTQRPSRVWFLRACLHSFIYGIHRSAICLAQLRRVHGRACKKARALEVGASHQCTTLMRAHRWTLREDEATSYY
jgi:hypothetical protein